MDLKLDDLNREQLLKAMKKLVRYGKVREDDVTAVIGTSTEEELSRAAFVLHALLCTRSHDTDGCQFYTSITSAEPCEDKVIWNQLVSAMVSALETTATELIKALNGYTTYVKSMTTLDTLQQQLTQFIIRNVRPSYPIEIDYFVQKLNEGLND